VGYHGEPRCPRNPDPSPGGRSPRPGRLATSPLQSAFAWCLGRPGLHGRLPLGETRALGPGATSGPSRCPPPAIFSTTFRHYGPGLWPTACPLRPAMRRAAWASSSALMSWGRVPGHRRARTAASSPRHAVSLAAPQYDGPGRRSPRGAPPNAPPRCARAARRLAPRSPDQFGRPYRDLTRRPLTEAAIEVRSCDVVGQRGGMCPCSPGRTTRGLLTGWVVARAPGPERRDSASANRSRCRHPSFSTTSPTPPPATAQRFRPREALTTRAPRSRLWVDYFR
jgi:hypothetical protein